MGMTFSFNAVGDELVSDENIVYDDDTYYSDVDPEAVEGMDDTSDIEVSGEINPSYSEATVEIDNIYNGEVNEYTDGEEYENVTYYDDTANVAGLADGLVMDPGYAAGDTGTVSDGMTVDGVVTQDADGSSLEGVFQQFFSLPESADPVRMSRRLSVLTKIPSPAGSDGELTTGQYIAESLQDMGYTVSTQSFHEGFLNDDLTDVPCINILAEKRPNTEDAGDRILLVMTHFDSKTDPEETDAFANDKTGAAVVLEMAELAADMDSDVDICFVFLSGEEDGNFGSANFAEGITSFFDRVIGAIYVGSVGYIMETSGSAGKTEEESEVSETEAAETELMTEPAGDISGLSDMTRNEGWKDKAFPYLVATPDGLENAVGMMIQSAVSDSSLRELEQAELEIAEFAADETDGVLSAQPLAAWEYEEDLTSGCSSFYENGIQTVFLHQDFSSVTEASEEAQTQEDWIIAGTAPEDEDASGMSPDIPEKETEAETEENVLIIPDPEALCEAANILANTVARYMAGME